MLANLLVLVALFAGYVLHERPTILPVIAGIAGLFAIGGVILTSVKLVNRRRP
ncbi:hypothetical protein ACFPFX_35110 [Streptomyces mauvecolor]|uniref:Uncharacterized protein n=1 Tax=Streptomyces mauvecolor TaxID=58345 RepID=A0ABV9UZ83_9ACTN